MTPAKKKNGSASTKPQVLAVGPWAEPEFAAACFELSGASHWRTTESLHAARKQLRQRPSTDVLLLAQPRLGYYRQSELDRLQREFPLVRTVVVAGSWCEGELRTGRPLQGALRLYWYELSRWWQAALRKLNAGEAPSWSQPLEGSIAGRCVSTDDLPCAAGVVVVVDTPDIAVLKTLESVLSAHGLSTVWHRAGDVVPASLAGAIWDGGQLGADELRQLSQFCNAIGTKEVPIVVLLDFPRVEHLQQAREAGATMVFGKPFDVAELIGGLVAV